MEIEVHYIEIKKNIVERTKSVYIEKDGDMAEVIRFLKSTLAHVGQESHSLKEFSTPT